MQVKLDLNLSDWSMESINHRIGNIWIETEIENDAIDQIFRIVDNPIHKNILGLVSRNRVLDFINAMFDYNNEKINLIIRNLKNSGIIEEPIRGYLSVITI